MSDVLRPLDEIVATGQAHDITILCRRFVTIWVLVLAPEVHAWGHGNVVGSRQLGIEYQSCISLMTLLMHTVLAPCESSWESRNLHASKMEASVARC